MFRRNVRHVHSRPARPVARSIDCGARLRSMARIHGMKFWERLFNVSSIIALIGYSIGTLILCGVPIVCGWKLLIG